MLFNSYEFVLLFFPATVLLFYFFNRFGARYGIGLVILSSFLFYSWWDVRFLALLIGSIIFNYLVATAVSRSVESQRESRATILLSFGIVANLGTLGFFKYGHFVLANWNFLFGTHLSLGSIVLPLGISFFTFEQIAYLIDVRRSQAPKPQLLPYAMFVSFFPRLVAGPILRYNEIFPQLTKGEFTSFNWDNLSVGLTIFFIGLFKKTFLADGISNFANVTFAKAPDGTSLDFFLSWGGALAYTFQLYFDFSAYSDMATGIARCFGIKFPVNFFSPYKATNIIEFWRRWHITLSRFLRDYLYFSLGGNRHGSVRRYANLMITMLLGGLWHGASWTFVFWGGLHGIYLVINHGWRAISRHAPRSEHRLARAASRGASWGVTFVAVVIGWVFFRANSFTAAIHMLEAMGGLKGASLPPGLAGMLGPNQKLLSSLGIHVASGSGTFVTQMYVWIAGLFAIAVFLPNTMELLADRSPALNLPPIMDSSNPARGFLDVRWKPTTVWSVAIAFVSFIAILSITRASEFLYWQF